MGADFDEALELCENFKKRGLLRSTPVWNSALSRGRYLSVEIFEMPPMSMRYCAIGGRKRLCGLLLSPKR